MNLFDHCSPSANRSKLFPVMPEVTKTLDAERREFPRIPFQASSLVIEPHSGDIVVGRTTELSQFGCFVRAENSLPPRSRIQIEIADDRDIFTARGVVAYVTAVGMGIAFGLVESRNYEILARWLSRK